MSVWPREFFITNGNVWADSPLWRTWTTPGRLKAEKRDSESISAVTAERPHKEATLFSLVALGALSAPSRTRSSHQLSKRGPRKQKTINLAVPRLGTFPEVGSGVSGEVVSAPSSTSWI